MRKRVYLWIMAFAALFLLYGCDNQTKQEQASQDANNQKQKIVSTNGIS